MLQAIRSKATSLVFKILFAVLIVTFGVWGIGDIFRNRGVDTTVATVGDSAIRAEELNQAVRRDMEQMRNFGGSIDIEKAKQLGLIDVALKDLIGRDLINLEMKRLHLAVGDDAVRQSILANPAFHNEAGTFDHTIYARALAQNRMSNQQYESLLRADIARNHLSRAITDGITAPSELVDELYRIQSERRVADILVLPSSAAGDIGAPSDADLTAYHDQHPELFRTPELRSFTVGVLRLDDLAAADKDKITDDKLRQEYDTRIDEFRTPEQRHLLQMLLPNEAKAQEAEAQLAEGKDFVEVAKQVAGAAPETVDLGNMKRSDLPPEFANAVFSLKPGETTQPVQSSLGWHVLRVVDVKPEETQPFDTVKDKLATEVAREIAGDDMAKMANNIDDDIAAGKTIEEIADKRGLKLSKVEGVDLNGHTAAGATIELPQPANEIVHTAFATDAGQMSPLTEIQDSGYYIVRTDKVTPSAVKPLADVRDQATQLWQKQQRDAALEKQGKEIVDQIAAGKALKDIADARKLAVIAMPPLLRSSGDARIPPALVAKLFELKPGQATTAAAAGDSYVVAQLRDVQQPDPGKDTAAVAMLAERVDAALHDDMTGEFVAALRQHFPVTVNQAAIGRLF